MVPANPRTPPSDEPSESECGIGDRSVPLNSAETTRVRLSVTRLWRLDVAVPFNPERGGRRWEVRLKHSDLTTFFWREPADVNAARARGVPSSVYRWP